MCMDTFTFTRITKVNRASLGKVVSSMNGRNFNLGWTTPWSWTRVLCEWDSQSLWQGGGGDYSLPHTPQSVCLLGTQWLQSHGLTLCESDKVGKISPLPWLQPGLVAVFPRTVRVADKQDSCNVFKCHRVCRGNPEGLSQRSHLFRRQDQQGFPLNGNVERSTGISWGSCQAAAAWPYSPEACSLLLSLPPPLLLLLGSPRLFTLGGL